MQTYLCHVVVRIKHEPSMASARLGWLVLWFLGRGHGLIQRSPTQPPGSTAYIGSSSAPFGTYTVIMLSLHINPGGHNRHAVLARVGTGMDVSACACASSSWYSVIYACVATRCCTASGWSIWLDTWCVKCCILSRLGCQKPSSHVSHPRLLRTLDVCGYSHCSQSPDVEFLRNLLPQTQRFPLPITRAWSLH